ncbi:PorP/SprF family type IX secretion system membrane protein [Hymenobacter ginkgonis]|uniref:PorP/SprF family type IX secretion system membrane protein n=1 Tax=Hymenobacter ginkgonis TaxID=2682976 RepID=UPI00293BC30C|nr:type IX secretion system membrane protein PorP/SprF [Hymenobacter ginkgonis]
MPRARLFFSNRKTIQQHRFVRKQLLRLLLLLGVATGTARPGQAQQLAQYSQYMNNNYLLNPAVAGTEDYIDLKFSYRTQWTGLEGAPKTYYASVNSALGGFHSQPKRTMQDWHRSYHSLGAIVYSDVTGPTSRTGVYGSYTYNLPLSRTLRLALGVSLGMQQFAVDGSQLQFHNVNTIAASQASMVPDATLGAWLYSLDFYAGLSSAQLLGNQLDIAYSPTNQLVYSNKLERHYFATAGVRLPLSNDFSLVPSVLVKFMSPAPAALDLNAKVKFRDLLWAGASWRASDAFVGMLGVNFSTVGSLSYSYDASTSALAAYQWGSHEVLLTIKLKKTPKVVCPDRFW